jgi:ATP/maltotriose-dependent transcriptional regulator MalT
VLDQLYGPLCDAVLGSSASAGHLRHLEAASLFMIPLDRRRQWYRYHALLSTVQRWYAALGDANIARYPPLAVLACWEGVLTGDIAKAERPASYCARSMTS